MNASRLIIVIGLFSVSAAVFAHGMPERKYSDDAQYVHAESSRESHTTQLGEKSKKSLDACHLRR